MIHLDAKTEYSFLRGSGSPERWLERCKEIGAPALGVADYCSTWGHIPFQKAFNRSGVKLLYGVQVPVCKTLEKDSPASLVTLIARTDGGLKLIYEVMSAAHQQRYYHPRATWSQLDEIRGEVEIIFTRGPLGELLNFEKIAVGYLGVGPNMGSLYRVVDDFHCVATGTPTYPGPFDREAYELITNIGDNRDNDGFHLTTRGEYLATIKIKEKQEWFEAADRISNECSASIPRANLPEIEGDLESLAIKGLSSRKIEPTHEYRERLDRELAVIKEKSFESYFIFVADLVSWARGRMLVGPARGSAGGSLICYLLGITEIDPIKHGTLFERFLDASRSDFPDIDIDFPDERRELVFDYLKDKYGADHVARLGTISRLGGKSAINDTCRALRVPFAVQRDIGKEFIDGDLASFFGSPPEHIKPLIEKFPEVSKAALIDGAPRHTGVHAAGVCITSDDIHSYGCIDINGIISLDLKAAESVGMLKMDALGLRTLSVLNDACEQIGMSPSALYDLPLDDPKVFEVFNKDLVTGVFQFEGFSVRGLMKKMRVSEFSDLCALTSLARPGPLMAGAAEHYAERRGGYVEWKYQHPDLEAHTGETYGTIVYQEQAMSIVRDIGGFNDAEVNAFRRAVGKKDPLVLAGFRSKFVDNATIGRSLAEDLWDEMCEFGSYAFNKSHAVGYSMISYYCAWFKAYHLLEFALAQLRNHVDDNKGKALLREVQGEGYEFVAFDPQRSEEEWSIQDGKLIGGFTSVKGVGIKTARAMLALRAQAGPTWLLELTDSQREKLLSPYNTPWSDIGRLMQVYRGLYKEPGKHRSEALPKGVDGAVYKIDELPGERGTYRIIGRLVRRQPKEKLDPNGNVVGTFCNIYLEDDTGEIGCTIARQKWPSFQWLMEDDYDGKDFIVKGSDINGDGRNWLFVDKIIQLGKDDRYDED